MMMMMMTAERRNRLVLINVIIAIGYGFIIRVVRAAQCIERTLLLLFDGAGALSPYILLANANAM